MNLIDDFLKYIKCTVQPYFTVVTRLSIQPLVCSSPKIFTDIFTQFSKPMNEFPEFIIGLIKKSLYGTYRCCNVTL